MNKNVQLEIQNAVRAIAQSMQPQKIYLFGSHANDTATLDSDIDLCVVAELGNMRKIEALRKMRRAMMAEVSLPIDLLVYDGVDFSSRAALTTTMENRIASEGKLLYGQ